MGNCREILLMTSCIVVMLSIGHQTHNLQNTFHTVKVQEQSMMKQAIPSLFRSFTDMTQKEIHANPEEKAETPILDLIAASLAHSVPVLSQHLTQDVIATVVEHSGFFPSNFLETADALFTYYPRGLYQSLRYMFNGLSGTYWNQFKRTYNYDYLDWGNRFQVASQVMERAYGVKPVGFSTTIPEEDSWLGNFLISLPNITFQTAANSSSWSNGFGNASTLFHNLGQQTWSGHYINDYNYLTHWDCYGCQSTFNSISLQMSIISQAPTYAFNTADELVEMGAVESEVVSDAEVPGHGVKHDPSEMYHKGHKPSLQGINLKFWKKHHNKEEHASVL